VYLTDLCQIRTILSAIAYGDFPLTRFGRTHLVEAVQIWKKIGLKFVVAQLESIELNQDRAISRMKIDDAADGLQFE
jgi:hypothetical protein